MFTEILKFCKLRNSIRKFKEDQKDQEEDALNQASSSSFFLMLNFYLLSYYQNYFLNTLYQWHHNT